MSKQQRVSFTEQELVYPTEADGRIPSFANQEEEAPCWDTHNITEFSGKELREIQPVIGGDLVERLTLRLDKADRDELARIARGKGVGPSTLARMWLKERLHQESRAGSNP